MILTRVLDLKLGLNEILVSYCVIYLTVITRSKTIFSSGTVTARVESDHEKDDSEMDSDSSCDSVETVVPASPAREPKDD